jgi:hypothetical protein
MRYIFKDGDFVEFEPAEGGWFKIRWFRNGVPYAVAYLNKEEFLKDIGLL